MNKCKWQSCEVRFIPLTPKHEFCSKSCRAKYKRLIDKLRFVKPKIPKKSSKTKIDYSDWLDYST